MRNQFKPKNPVELVDFDARHFLMTCQKHGMSFIDIAAYLKKDQHALQRALETGKINPRWLATLAKKFHIESEFLRVPSPGALLPLRVYISMPRVRFAMTEDMVNGMYDHLTEVIREGYLKSLAEAFPTLDAIEIVRPDMKREDGSWHTRTDVTSMSNRLIRTCDLIVFAPQWGADVECQVEHKLALYYAKEIIYINDEPETYLERLGIKLEKLREESSDE